MNRYAVDVKMVVKKYVFYLFTFLGHYRVVELLLRNKSNVDHQTKTGCTPLMEATRLKNQSFYIIYLTDWLTRFHYF